MTVLRLKTDMFNILCYQQKYSQEKVWWFDLIFKVHHHENLKKDDSYDLWKGRMMQVQSWKQECNCLVVFP